MSKIMSFNKQLFAALKDVGLADDLTARVVIDIRAGQPVVAYVQKFTDETVINVVQTLAGVEITRKQRTDGSDGA